MRETLIQYQGGRYSGCIWEWNFGFFDKQGKYHDIFSSGSMGCPNQPLIESYIADNKPQKDYYLYRMTSEKALKSLATETNIVNLSGVIKWFNDNFPEYEPYALCSKCKCKMTNMDEDGIFEGWHGCGGIMSTAGIILCRECYGLGYCPNCEYVGAENIRYDEDKGIDGCIYCVEEPCNQ